MQTKSGRKWSSGTGIHVSTRSRDGMRGDAAMNTSKETPVRVGLACAVEGGDVYQGAIQKSPLLVSPLRKRVRTTW